MTTELLATFIDSPTLVRVPKPHAFALKLLFILGGVTIGGNNHSLHVIFERKRKPFWRIAKDKGFNPVTGKNINLSVPEPYYKAVLKWFDRRGCGSITLGNITYVSVWDEGEVVGWITVKMKS